MTPGHPLSKREKEVVNLLLQGKSNKHIALALGIAEHTVEFHLKNIYAKLLVSSRTEAVIKLGESVVHVAEKLGKPIVAGEIVNAHNDANIGTSQELSDMDPQFSSHRTGGIRGQHIFAVLTILILPAILFFMISASKPWKYQRESESCDKQTVGQTISRSNASATTVHGQFGSTDQDPWPAQAGYLTYEHIKTPKIDRLYMTIRYSKYSPEVVPILIFLDDEPTPRAMFYPTNLGDWNTFVWAEPIFLGSVERGNHSILFFTQGQPHGVADLDLFVLRAD